MTITRATPIDTLPAYLRVGEAAQFLGVSKYLVYEMVKTGALRGNFFGRLLRIPREALLDITSKGRNP